MFFLTLILEFIPKWWITSLDNPLGFPPSLETLWCHSNPLKYNFKPTLENIRNYNASRMLSS
jgi:hypothetical protein